MVKWNNRRFLEILVKGVKQPRDIPHYVRKKLRDVKKIVKAIKCRIKSESEFDIVEKYCMFIGHGRTGHSLVGSLLNAHPEIVISHELDVLKFINYPLPVRRNTLFQMILCKDRNFNNKEREWNRYEYDIPYKWQGRFDKMRIIGDKKGGKSSSILKGNTKLMSELKNVVKIPIRIIHVVRNPFDVLASRYKLTGSWDPYLDRFFRRAESVNEISKILKDCELCRIYYEDLINNPKRVMSGLIKFLGVKEEKKYLSVCSEFIFDSPKQTRYNVEWPNEKVKKIELFKKKYEWLSGYKFND